MLRTRVLSPSKSRKRYPGTGPLGNTRRKGRKHKAKSSLLANTTTTSNTSLLTNLNTRKQLRKGMTFPSRVVKKLERLEIAQLRILHRLPFRIGLLQPRNSAYNLAFHEVMDYRGI